MAAEVEKPLRIAIGRPAVERARRIIIDDILEINRREIAGLDRAPWIADDGLRKIQRLLAADAWRSHRDLRRTVDVERGAARRQTVVSARDCYRIRARDEKTRIRLVTGSGYVATQRIANASGIDRADIVVDGNRIGPLNCSLLCGGSGRGQTDPVDTEVYAGVSSRRVGSCRINPQSSYLREIGPLMRRRRSSHVRG